MKIAIAQIWQEQNTFSPNLTDFEVFKSNGFFIGDEIISNLKGINEIGGFLKAFEESDIEVFPLIRVFAWAGGKVKNDTYKIIKDEFLRKLSENLLIDGLLISFHGSMVSEDIDDIEGDLIKSAKLLLKRNIPIVASFDLHANITNDIYKNLDCFIGYHTCPHFDLFETGYKAANIIINLIKNKEKLCKSFVKIPMITPANNHNTFKGPLKELFDIVGEIENDNDILSSSIFPVQPWLDIKELGWSCVVFGKSNTPRIIEKVKIYCNKLANFSWENKERFFLETYSPKYIIKYAERIKKGTVVISDSDSTTSGGTGDNTCILTALLESKTNISAILTLVDPEFVKQALGIITDKKISGLVGGKLDCIYSQPIYIEGIIEKIYENVFSIDGHLGKNLVNMGKTVIVKVNNIIILISEHPGPVYEQGIFLNAGYNPADFRIVAVKSPVGFRASFEPIAKKIFISNCKGISPANLNMLKFYKINKPLYPFDEINNFIPKLIIN